MAKMTSETIAVTVSSIYRDDDDMVEKIDAAMVEKLEVLFEELFGGSGVLVEVTKIRD